MTRKTLVAALIAISTAGVIAQGGRAYKPGADWPAYRGPNGAGVADGHRLPTTWDVAAKQGVKWTMPVEGLGHSSPTIWGDQLCVITAISGKLDNSLLIGQYGDIASVEDNTSHTWKLICADKTNGKPMFERVMHTGVPTIKRHTKSTHANTTLATDGSYLVAMLGSEGLYVYDMKGTLVWKKDLGVLDSGFYMVPEAQWEFSSSPVLHEGVVVIQADVQKNSFLAAFDVKTGKEIWRVPRSDVPTFGTPAIHRVGDQTQIIVNGWRHMGAYDFKTGKEIWKINGGGDIPVPVPVIGDGLIYITNAHGAASPIYAIRDTATGDISLKPGETTSDGIVWSAPREGAYLITPVLYQGVLYVCKTNGVLSAFDAKIGERLYLQRLGKGVAAFTSSLVAGDGKVYVTSEEGDVYVIKAGRTSELLATNPLGELMLSTPAISEGVLYFRTNKQIIAIQN